MVNLICSVQGRDCGKVNLDQLMNLSNLPRGKISCGRLEIYAREILLPEGDIHLRCSGSKTGYRLPCLLMHLAAARIVWSEWGDVEPGRGDFH